MKFCGWGLPPLSFAPSWAMKTPEGKAVPSEVATASMPSVSLVASMVHFGDYTCSGIKQTLADAGVKMRMSW